SDGRPARRSSVSRSPGGRSFIWQSLSAGKLFAVNSIRLVSCRADRFEEAVDHKIVFERHAQLAGDSAFDHCFFYHTQHEHLGNAGAAIFFNYAKSDQATLLDAILVEQQFEQTNWKPKSCQPAVEIAQDHI